VSPAVASCWMCGTLLPQHQMLPDGGAACDDVRWYCRDTRACTERWTMDQHQRQDAGTAAGPISALLRTGLPARQPSLPTMPSASAWPGQRGR
jgi:hypothetical protein